MRLLLALWLGKFIFFLTRFLKIGGGSAAPGYYALKIDPGLVQKLAPQIPQNVVITGTNGKTTTARLLNHLVKSQQITTLRNSTGSNLERGIASALINQSSLFGQISKIDLGIWELDEAAFNSVLPKLIPQIVVFLNAFRDQLDRYGEVDSVRSKWWQTLSDVSWEMNSIVNESDPTVSSLGAISEHNANVTSSYFKVKGHTMFQEKTVQIEHKVHEVDFEATIKKNLGLKGTDLVITHPGGKLELAFHIPGLYHIYDLLAAFSVYFQLNLSLQNLQEVLKDFDPAFGRVEKVTIKGVESYLFLIKNPAGANSVFETIQPELTSHDTLLVALNDNFADGKDVSWIWDAQFEELIPKKPNSGQARMTIYCSGQRANDLAVRFKYAGVDPKQITIEPDLEKAIMHATKEKPKRLFILPTYTALLELQKILANMGAKQHYWKE